jgi:putative methionine-R-sulfoxide reductase with GAF domain
MSAVPDARRLSARDLEPILEVAAKLAAPFDLTRMLTEVTDAARNVLEAERCTVWLYDREADELVLRLASDLKHLRIPANKGIAGSCARSRRIINVPDCYADSRFDRSIDAKSGFRTRCMLALPLVDHDDQLVGVMQVLNKQGAVFDEYDERLAAALAAQCAVALQRARMTEALIESEKMRQQLEMARVVQMSSLPSKMPEVPGYELMDDTPRGADRWRHLRPHEGRGARARRAWRCDRPRHRPRALGHADAGDAAHGLPPRRRSRARLRRGEQPPRRGDARATASSPRSSACWIRRRIDPLS